MQIYCSQLGMIIDQRLCYLLEREISQEDPRRRFIEDDTEEILKDTGFSKKLDESIAQADRGELVFFESLKVRLGLNQ